MEHARHSKNFFKIYFKAKLDIDLGVSLVTTHRCVGIGISSVTTFEASFPARTE